MNFFLLVLWKKDCEIEGEEWESRNMVESRRMVDARITWEGCSVLLDINDGDRIVFARLSPSS